MNHNFSIQGATLPGTPSTHSIPTRVDIMTGTTVQVSTEQSVDTLPTDTLPGTTAPVSTEHGVDTVKRSTAATAGRYWGYVRVSTREQNEARQLIALEAFGIPQDHIYLDKQSGKDFHRPAWQALMNHLQPGDVLVVKSIDRLGRNYSDILEQWRYITKTLNAAIVVLDMPLLDTRSTRDLTGTLISDIVLQLLSYVAETERAFIRARQAEGIAAAKAKGVHFGRKPMERPDNFLSVYHLWKTKRIGSMEAGRRLGVSHVTFLKWARASPPQHPHSADECGDDCRHVILS